MATAGILAMLVAVNWEPCRLSAGPFFPTSRARCSAISVPLDPSREDGPKLELFVAKIAALQPKPEPDPLVIIAGGPGQSAAEFFVTTETVFDSIHQKRDILLIDQRGTGRSSPLHCSAHDGLGIDHADPDEIGRRVKRCLDALPNDPRYFTTSVAVRDLDRVRRVLGVDQWNLYGISYGSRVASHYLQRFPDRVRSLVLDGVVARDRVLGSRVAILAQKTLENVFDRCRRDQACRAALGDPSEQLRMLLTRLDSAAAPTASVESSTHPTPELDIDAHEMRSTLRWLSYRSETQAVIPLLIKLAAIDGDLAPLAMQTQVVAQELDRHLSYGMYFAVVCSEDVPELPDDLAELRSQLRATYFGSKEFDTLRAVCAHWPRGLVDDDFRTPIQSDVPALILSGEFDPITPPDEASSLVEQLSGARHVIAAGQGHGVMGIGCLRVKVAEFIEAADAGAVDFDCAERLKAFPLMLDLYGPAP